MNNIRQSGVIALAALWLILALGNYLPALSQTPEIRPLTRGQTVERELKGGEAHSYSVALTAGQYLNVVVEQKGIDVIVTLFDPTGKKAAEVDSPNGTLGPEPISMIAEATGNYRLEVRSLKNTAALGYYEAKLKELRTATEQDKNAIVAQQIFNEAELLSSEGTTKSLQETIKKYEESLRLFRAAKDNYREGLTLNQIGFVYDTLGEKQKALDYYNQALPLRRAVKDTSGEAQTLSNIGFVYDSIGERQKALDYYDLTLSLRKAIDDKGGQAITLTDIGVVYSAIDEKQKALDYYNQALSLYRKVGDKQGEAIAMADIAGVYDDLGEHQKALDYFAQALKLEKEVENAREEAIALNDIGLIYIKLGKYAKALEYFAPALQHHKAAGDRREEAIVLNNIGAVSLNLKENTKALDYFSQALPLYKAVGDRREEAVTLRNIGSTFNLLGNKQKALDYYIQALPLFRAVGDRSGEATIFNSLLLFYESQNTPRPAIFYGKQSANIYQQLRSNIQSLDKDTQKTYLKSVEQSYRDLTRLMFKQERYAEAQQILDAFKDQQFFDFDQKQQLKPLMFTPREVELVLRFDRMVNDVGTIGGEVMELKLTIGNREANDAETKRLKKLEAQFKTTTDEFKNFIKQAETEFAAPPDDKDKISLTADLQEMQLVLREISQQTGQKTAAVYQFVGADKYSSLLITPDSIDAVSYPIKGVKLNQKALQLWKLLRTPEYDPQPIAAELYKIVFAPLAAKLPRDTKTILWSLDGNLRYVPMAVLHDGKQYLVERFNNVIFTRADKERLTRAVSRNWTGTGLGSSKEQNVKLFGTTYKFEPLFAVETELGRMFKKANPKGIFAGDVLLDAEFTKTAMITALKNRRPLVHIASHFKFEAGDEARSFLLLGDGSPFTLDEMKVEKDLFGGVELLTLSACQTAAQRPNANGREVDGFAELAQRLGAGAIMASLWELSDDSTAELMTRFYRTYNDGKTNKAEALRTAQIALLKGDYKETSSASRRKPLNEADIAASIKIEKTKLRLYKSPKDVPFAHPFYWSPFVLFGNWQ